VQEIETSQEAEVTDESRWNLLNAKVQETRALSAFTLLRENGIEPILIKGLAAARFYPESGSRDSVDMDLAVADRDFESAQALANSVRLGIDLHRELRHLDTVEWIDLFENSRLLPVEGGEIRVLRAEDSLRVLCVHWLTNGGEEKHRLWDVYYAVKNRPADFDWDRFLNVVSGNRRQWLIYMIGLAHKYLELDLDDTPIKDEAKDVPNWLIDAVEKEWKSGVPLLAIHTLLRNPKMLFTQMRKRLPPNPIMATVEMEGSFDAKTRVFYQIGSFFCRMTPSYRRMTQTISQQWK
jgi:hypothetical protein